MKILNVHECLLPRPAAEVLSLFEGLGTRRDRLWPSQAWPRMHLDRGLNVCARGGHGPIRYRVECVDDDRIRFRFEAPRGFEGIHELLILPAGDRSTRLQHRIEMRATGPARLTWPLFFRPLHDALIEDLLAGAEVLLGLPPRPRPWSPGVRMLRFVFSRGRAPAQRLPAIARPVETPLPLR